MTERLTSLRRNMERAKTLAAELYFKRCQHLAMDQIDAYTRGSKQQPLVLQGIREGESTAILRELNHAGRRAAAQACDDANAAVDKIFADVEGSTDPDAQVRATIHKRIRTAITALHDSEQVEELDPDDEDDEDNEDETPPTPDTPPTPPTPPAADETK